MKILCRDLGKMDYSACWELQRTLFGALLAEKNKQRNSGAVPDGSPAPTQAGTVLLVEHPPVYTLGKSGRAENLLIDRSALERLGAQFFHIDRGGDITFHGPGQLVCYPILDLERIGIGLREYIWRLEETVIRTVARFGIAAGRIDGASGVWIGGWSEVPTTGTSDPTKEPEKEPGSGSANGPDARRSAPRKICAIGVRSSRYVTMHGFALNVNTDLDWFSRINPCGFSDRGVASIARETGRKVAMEEVKQLVLQELERQFDLKIEK